jgi:hypothetical protein
MSDQKYPKSFWLLLLLIAGISCKPYEQAGPVLNTKVNFSGIFPHLAFYNEESECGTGAVVPWADRLWVITYGPHLPFGSSDKLYEITPDLRLVVRRESVGGTPANRMIHPESNQLFIGPYAIDAKRNVRTIAYALAPGRYTGLARHLTEPSDKIYIATMEEGFYEVNVHSLATKTLYEDGNLKNKKGDDIAVNQPGSLLPGAHGKGVYSGQGVMVYSNNGEAVPEALTRFDIKSGALAEWDGNEWKIVRRNQFVEVTGPGGIYGNENPETDPIWATGWDHKSLILGVRGSGKWSFFRLPQASHSYDGAHGWNTEWPRIRDVGTKEKPDYLMTMHGMFWHFPKTFSLGNSMGIRPRSAYLKVIGDFTRWNDQLVFGCDDAARKEFLNKRKVKGDIMGPGESNSNLWFTSVDLPDELGPNTAGGAVWLNETVRADEPSEPFLFAGWARRTAWIQNHGDQDATFKFETDNNGNGSWAGLREIRVTRGNTVMIEFPSANSGEWIRVKSNLHTTATVYFAYSDEEKRRISPDNIFRGLANVKEERARGGLVYSLGNNRRALGMVSYDFQGPERSQTGYYELDVQMNLKPKNDLEMARFIDEKFSIPDKSISIDRSSVLVIDDKGRRWRLPLGDDAFTDLTNAAALRIAREVVTERDLFNCHGTFYELPAENADGFAKIRPIASHNFRIHDYASYRGMLIITGVDPDKGKGNAHIIVSDDGKAAVWAGVIDDLWKLGKPIGRGGPWKDTSVKAGEPSDPYLIGFYDRRNLSLSHNSTEAVTFLVEAEPIGHGPWMRYKELTVASGEILKYEFPANFQSRWIRFTADKAAVATAWLDYN